MKVIDSPEVCAARVVDPIWQAKQKRKTQEASDRFAAWRAANNMPLIAKVAGQRF